jgi:riboflavin kinase/FMN adenylyltransferase
MQYFESIDSAALRGVYLTVGSFDGLHRGHLHLLEKMTQAALEDGAAPVVLTFYPHPKAVLRSAADSPPFRYLIPLEERLALLRALPLEAIVLQPFDPAFYRISAAEFLQTLKNRLGLRSLWCGPSFSLGFQREGNVAYLTEKSVALGFSLYVIPPLDQSGGPISSSRIRQALAEGDPRLAADLLGRRFSLSGTVIHGAGRGRKMGTPTANLDLWPEIAIPAYGVYAVWAVAAGRRYAGVTSIGIRPTFENGSAHAATVETHLLDFNGDIYGSILQVEFVERLRGEEKFPDMDSLRGQMARDIERARRVLEEEV